MTRDLLICCQWKRLTKPMAYGTLLPQCYQTEASEPAKVIVRHRGPVCRPPQIAATHHIDKHRPQEAFTELAGVLVPYGPLIKIPSEDLSQDTQQNESAAKHEGSSWRT